MVLHQLTNKDICPNADSQEQLVVRIRERTQFLLQFRGDIFDDDAGTSENIDKPPRLQRQNSLEVLELKAMLRVRDERRGHVC